RIEDEHLVVEDVDPVQNVLPGVPQAPFPELAERGERDLCRAVAHATPSAPAERDDVLPQALKIDLDAAGRPAAMVSSAAEADTTVATPFIQRRRTSPRRAAPGPA